MSARSAASFVAVTLAAVSTVFAAEPEDPTKPVSGVSAGLGYVDRDGRRFGQYNGMNEKGGYGLLDVYLNRRDDTTGTWTQLEGRNLGLDSRQLRFDQNRQGNWGYYIEYGRIQRNEPYSITTGVGGIGSSNLTVPGTPTTGSPVDLKTTRDAIGLGFNKFFMNAWDLQVRFRNEEKDGARLFARGTTGNLAGFPGNFEFTPEPINSTTRQLDVILGYTGDKLQLSGGYYGTMFNNKNNALNVTGGVAALATPAATAFTPIALPPDNSSHQLNLSGGYNFTPSTRGSFKLAYTNAKQDDAFLATPGQARSATIGNNLDAKVETTLAQAGIVSRPMANLTLRADLRREDVDDKTPVRQYFTQPAPGSTTTATGENEPRSITRTRGMLEASYMLPQQFRLTGGIDSEEKKRNTSPVRIVSFRETTEEISYRVELRRSMSETLTGALQFVHSDRGGSQFQNTTVFNGTAGSNLIAPLHLADRDRDKIRFTSNWTPLEPLSIQFFVDYADDTYTGRDGSGLGPRSGKAQNYSLDAAYRFTDKWQGNLWFNRNDTRAEQATCESATSVGVCPAAAGNPTYSASLRSKADSFGMGFRGKPNDRLMLGGDLNYSIIKDSYGQQSLAPATDPTAAGLPEISTRLVRFNLYGKYMLDKSSSVRVDYIFDRYKTNDWTWANWAFADGTTVNENPNQRVNYLGASYIYRWQ
jgi:MtrB/PioB family decaheme-associated outer membrane protein